MKTWSAVLFLVGFLLAACTTQIPTPSQAEIRLMAAQTLASDQHVTFRLSPEKKNELVQATVTPTPEPPVVIQFEATQAPMNIATQIALPKQGPKSSRIYGLSVLDNGSLLVMVEYTPLPEATFSAELGPDRLQCTTLPENPSRIYCHGTVTQFDLIQPFRLYQTGIIDPVFMSDLWVPPIPISDPDSTAQGIEANNQNSSPLPPGSQETPALRP